MKRVTLVILICLVLAATTTACRLVAPTPDPKMIERLVAEAVQATIEAMPTATPYPTYTPVPLAPTYTPSASVNTPQLTPSFPPKVGGDEGGAQPGVVFRTHIVVAGDTLSGIAREYGTTVEAIMEANALKDAGLIIIGQVLSIPVEEAGPAPTPTTPTPSLTPTTTLTSTTPTMLTPITTPTETPAS